MFPYAPGVEAVCANMYVDGPEAQKYSSYVSLIVRGKMAQGCLRALNSLPIHKVNTVNLTSHSCIKTHNRYDRSSISQCVGGVLLC